jgi:PAS domain-containing protein
MKDEDKTKEQLVNELVELRQRITQLEKSETSRKWAEEALRESEETARALLNAPIDSLILIDPEGTILAINEIAAQGLGKRVDELVGVCVYNYPPPEKHELMKSFVQGKLCVSKISVKEEFLLPIFIQSLRRKKR